MPKRQPPAALSKDRPKRKVVKAPRKTTKSPIYQLKITLDDVKPPIWRRLQTQDCTLAQLHDLIQVSMGWHDSHLHLFKIGQDRYGDPVQWPKEFEDDLDTLNERKLKLSQLHAQGTRKFSYEYDMGDSWLHLVQIEKLVEAEPGVKYPRCIDGKRACPPEDCGGPWGYGDFLDALADPKHEQHADMVEWIGGEFDPENFDLEEVNRLLRGLS